MHCWYLLAEAINVRNTVKYRVNSQLINLVKRNKPFFYGNVNLFIDVSRNIAKQKQKQKHTHTHTKKNLGKMGYMLVTITTTMEQKYHLTWSWELQGFSFTLKTTFWSRFDSRHTRIKIPLSEPIFFTFSDYLLYDTDQWVLSTCTRVASHQTQDETGYKSKHSIVFLPCTSFRENKTILFCFACWCTIINREF